MLNHWQWIEYMHGQYLQLSCGHRCPQQCHNGVCPPADKCQRKVTIRCGCRHIKKEFRCSEATKVSCDAECTRILREQEQVSQECGRDNVNTCSYAVVEEGG